MSEITRDAVVHEARRLLGHFEHRITPDQAILMAAAELLGAPLDPFAFHAAAVLLRAERLFIEDVPIDEALATARRELLATFSCGGRS